MVITYTTRTHTQTQVQRSVDSKDRLETFDRWTGQTDRRTLPIANAVGNRRVLRAICCNAVVHKVVYQLS